MIGLKIIKKRISSVTSIEKMTKAMKLISAVKLRKSTINYNNITSYYDSIYNILPYFFSIKSNIKNKILNRYIIDACKKNRLLLIIITSDKGLLGNFNNKIITYANNIITNDMHDNIDYLCIGNKAISFFKNKKNYLYEYSSKLDTAINIDFISKITLYITKCFDLKKYDDVKVIYYKFVKINQYNLMCESLLPIKIHYKSCENYIIEYNSINSIIEVINNAIKFKILKCIYSSIVSENTARMIAMDQATNNSKDLLKELKLKYNNIRQNIVTKEIIEIIGGNINAM
ncbi:MAG: F0F1 ATP synthase subunit gamma [Bacteroides sp.]|nr:MAG: F0F1 ATP synthase subunit gamma [Bacteroides sp.]